MSKTRQNAAYAKAALGDTGTLIRVPAMAHVIPSDDSPNEWCVDSLDASGEGSFFTTVFLGPSARERAIEYAQEKYAGFQVHAPDR
jgi:hypothetical protein